MAKQVQLRRGTTAQHSAFTGALGEVTVDTDKKVAVVHDGSTAGGIPLAKQTTVDTKVDKVTSTDNAIARYDGTGGAIQNSSVIIDDDGTMTITANVNDNILLLKDSSDSEVTHNFINDENGNAYYLQYSEGQVIKTNISSNGDTYFKGGNVGIGTSSPSDYNSNQNKLVIDKGGANTGITIVTDSSHSGTLAFADGTSGSSPYVGMIQYRHSTDNMGFYTGGSERMRIDSSGNLGIGVTPSAWGSGQKAIEIGPAANGFLFNDSNNVNLGANAYYNAGWKYQTSSVGASRYAQSSGRHTWGTAPSGTAGNAITFTQAMTLDASGDLIVPNTYSNTTASAANMYIDSVGKFYRSTSSRKYKTNIENVEQQYIDSFFNNARPIYYKSLSENDNPNWGYWGFIAEEIAEFDPRLVHWRYSLTKQELVSEAVEEVTEDKIIDAVLDDEGNEIEPSKVEKVIVTPAQEAQYKEVPDTDSPLEAEGVMYERIVVMLTAKIQELEARIKFLEAK